MDPDVTKDQLNGSDDSSDVFFRSYQFDLQQFADLSLDQEAYVQVLKYGST